MPAKLINRAISILYRYNQRFFMQTLKERSMPIEVGQLPSLIQAYRYPGITQDGISANVGIDKATVARTVKQLEDAGIIMRETDEKDRRINHIYATPKGLEMREEAFRIINELHEILYQGFSESEIEVAYSLLERMKANISRYLSE